MLRALQACWFPARPSNPNWGYRLPSLGRPTNAACSRLHFWWGTHEFLQKDFLPCRLPGGVQLHLCCAHHATLHSFTNFLSLTAIQGVVFGFFPFSSDNYDTLEVNALSTD